jgi:hypothetical protein
MNAQNDNTAPSSTTTWWRWGTPSRSGMQRLIAPWEYRHLRAWARVRIAIGAVLVGLGAVTLVGGSFSTKAAGWATLFLAAAAAQLLFAAWERAIARSASARTRACGR